MWYRPPLLGWCPLATKQVKILVRATNVPNTRNMNYPRMLRYEMYILRGVDGDEVSFIGDADTCKNDCREAREIFWREIGNHLTKRERTWFKASIKALLMKIR